MDEYTGFLYAAAPFFVGFLIFVGIAILVLKIAINAREKKLSSKPQQFNRFDLDNEADSNDNP